MAPMVSSLHFDGLDGVNSQIQMGPRGHSFDDILFVENVAFAGQHGKNHGKKSPKHMFLLC